MDVICLKYILSTISAAKTEFLQSKLCNNKKVLDKVPKDKLFKIHDLLLYAPDIFLNELEDTLHEYKDLTLKFKK